MVRRLFCLAAILLAAGCSESPVAPTPDLRISCPAPPRVAVTTPTAVVVYDAPGVTGGSAPVSVSCTPPSGSAFPIGSSTVTCMARDAQQRTQSCGFAVTVERIPTIEAVRFVAFGDSITYGVLPSCPALATSVFDLRLDLPLLLRAVDIPASYPTKLQSLLSGHYAAQSLQVLNEGEAGETVQNGSTRLPGVLAQDSPQVLLLQEGVNDLNGGATGMTVADGLRRMVRDARTRGVQVFLGTLLPQRADGCRARTPSRIAPTNDLIRGLASAEGATLVDLYQAFVGMESSLLGVDGLHPTEAGYERMAQTFFEAIRQKLEESGLRR